MLALYIIKILLIERTLENDKKQRKRLLSGRGSSFVNK